MKLNYINKLHEQLENGIITYREFEGAIYHYYSGNQRKTGLCRWKKDEYEDFLSWFYPYINKAVNKYKDTGNSFESYMYKFMLIASKEYKTNTVSNSVIEYSLWSARIHDNYLHENQPEYHFDNSREIIKRIMNNKNSTKNTRRILTLLIKCYSYISDDFIEKIAPVLNMEKDKLKEMIDNIRILRQKKDDEIYELKEQIFSLFYKCIAYEKKLLLLKKDSGLYIKQERRLNFARKRLEKLRNRLVHTRKEATNSQVAKVIGISKGCVDSNLYKLKLRFMEKEEK